MNPYVTYISGIDANKISCLPVSLLSAYMLTVEEQEYIANLLDDTAAVISSTLLSAAIRGGSSLYTQTALNKLYIRRDNANYSETDKKKLKDFLDRNMVGNTSVSFSELSSTGI